MFDTHFKLSEFGIMPDILGFPSYTLFVGLGIIAGILYYLADANKRHASSEGVVQIVSAALIFGVLGSKIPLILEGADFETILFGKSIVGGLLGGMLGVILIKRILGIQLKMGNVIAPAVALGMAVGRIGCFLNGCCYGIPSNWGVDFGDGLLRYPTQLFEVGFHFSAFLILHHYKLKVKTPGILFKLYVSAYFLFRFMIEFIRENPVVYLGLTLYQLLCILGIGYTGWIWVRQGGLKSVVDGQ
jgi:phosphatidylglycerol:prolipoprotein diacylglycerol transferase